MPVVQLAAHAKSSTLYGRSYGRTSKFFRLDGLLLFCIIMGLRSASSAIEYLKVLPLEWSSVSRKGNFLSLENTKQFIFKFKSE